MHYSTIIRAVSLAAIAVMLSSPSVFAQSSAFPYLDPKLPVEKRVDNLLARMSLEQKLGQLRSDLRSDSAFVFVGRDGIGGLGPVQPVKELKGFQRLFLRAGEERLVTFRIDRSHLSFLDVNLRPVVEPGEVEVMIGSSSEDIRLSGYLMIGR